MGPKKILRVTESRPPVQPAWPATLVFSVAAAALAVAAAMMMFSTFMFYDDEGYVLISLRNFAEHGHLYGEVFSQYGPFPYVLYYALHLLGLPLTHTAGRLLTIGAWSGAAIASAALAGHATRSLAVRLAVLASVFVYLWVMVSEPSHPGGLIAVLTAVLAWLGHRWIDTGQTRKWALLAGGGAVALALTKINVGAFAALSAIAWLLLHHDSPVVRRRAPAILAVGVILFPFALMRPLLGTPWALTFAVMFAGAGLTTVGAAMLDATTRAGWRTAWAGVLAALAVALVVIGVVFARGTTPLDLLDGVLLRPFRHPVHFNLTFVWPPGTCTAAIVAAGLFVAASELRRRGVAAVDPAIALLRVAATLAVVVAVARFPAISPDSLVFAFAMPWLWLFMWPLAGEPAAAIAGRRWVGLLFLGQCLHAFPVPGSQVAWGTFLAIPVAALGGWSAASWLVARFAVPGPRLRALGLALQLAIAGFAVATGWQLAQIGRRYEESSDFGLPGAEHLRLPDRTTALYQVLTLNAVAHSDMLFSLPGMFSLNLWTGLPTPTLANVTHWFSLLDDAEQQAIIRALEAHPRVCVIVQRGHLNFLRDRGFAPSGPLDDYVTKNFTPAFTLDDFEFCVRRGRHIAPLMLAEAVALAPSRAPDSTRIENAAVRVTLVLPAGRPAARVEIAAVGGASDAPLVLDAADSRVEITPASAEGEPRSPTEPRAWPFKLAGPAVVTIYFNRDGQPRPVHGAVITVRDSAGAVLGLARLQQ